VPPTYLSFIRPAKIGRIHFRDEKLSISEWGIFGGLVGWPLLLPRGSDLVAEVTSK
jgi:hypothetical protein